MSLHNWKYISSYSKRSHTKNTFYVIWKVVDNYTTSIVHEIGFPTSNLIEEDVVYNINGDDLLSIAYKKWYNDFTIALK